MRCINLTTEEKKFLHKCILRLHKESGNIIAFKNNEKYSQGNFMKGECDLLQISQYLIEPLWNVYKNNCQLNKGENAIEIRASLFYLGIIDLIYDSKYPIFKKVSAEIANSEFGYIDDAITNILLEAPEDFTEELKKEINDAFSKYSHLSEYTYVNIPYKLKVKFD